MDSLWINDPLTLDPLDHQFVSHVASRMQLTLLTLLPVSPEFVAHASSVKCHSVLVGESGIQYPA